MDGTEDFRTGLGDLRRHRSGRGDGGDLVDGPNEIKLHGWFPFGLEAGQGFLAITAADGHSEKTSIALIQIEWLNTVRGSGGLVGFRREVYGSDLDFAAAGILDLIEQGGRPGGERL